MIFLPDPVLSTARPSPELRAFARQLEVAAMAMHQLAHALADLGDLTGAAKAARRRDSIRLALLDEIDAAIDRILPAKVAGR
jgi:hypothetical protein